MKILWIVNTIFPYPAKQLNIKETCFGGWLNGLANALVKDENINMAIATTYNGNNVKKFFDGKTEYYLIPKGSETKYNKKQELYWKHIAEEFQPQLVHIHGTEYAHGLAFLKACPEIKSIVSIQGLVSRCSDVYLGNMDIKDVIKNITLRNIITRSGILRGKRKFAQKGKYETEIVKRANIVLGRTMWDYANTRQMNPQEEYYVSNETLREIFYDNNWNINNIERHTLFCSQAGYPLKGFHYLVKAVYILKNKYKDIKLYVAGPNIIDSSTLYSKLKRTDYGKYIKNLIKQYNLENDIIFTGLLNEKEMIERLLKTHVFVLPSVIENSSNSLCEAMILGMPCVASNTGGTMDILEHKKEGFLYPYTESAVCAEYISQFFNDDKKAVKMGKNARITAQKRHDRRENTKTIIEIYTKAIGGK